MIIGQTKLGFFDTKPNLSNDIFKGVYHRILEPNPMVDSFENVNHCNKTALEQK